MWLTHLLDISGGVYEYHAPFVDDVDDQRPDNQARRNVRQEKSQICLEERAPNDAQSANVYGHAQSQPKWAQRRASIALADVLPGQQRPKAPLHQTLAEIARRKLQITASWN